MSTAIIRARAQVGVSAPQVFVETHLSNGLPSLAIVGMPETAVKESKERVRSAILNSGFEFPARRITINLSPADLPKQGGRYDLAIAISILVASQQARLPKCQNIEFLGELSLSGKLRPIRSALSAVIESKRLHTKIMVAKGNELELALAEHTEAATPADLCSAVEAFANPNSFCSVPLSQPSITLKAPNLNEVQGQHLPKRALEIAAAGRLNVLMYGPPGTGKSMLASRLPSISPKLPLNQALETCVVHSLREDISGKRNLRIPPFRYPHHSASPTALIGGGTPPAPGEVSMAHNGILFMDELPEFGRKAIEMLREPLETGEVRISRASQTATFPARFQLIAAMNPCPCGFLGHPTKSCHDTPQQIQNYRRKLSGPLLDRIDMHVEVPFQHGLLLNTDTTEENSEKVLSRVEAAQERQLDRQACLNSELKGKALLTQCQLDVKSTQLLEKAIHKFAFSNRVIHRILRISRTIADLRGQSSIELSDVSEAIGYRSLDKPVD